MNDIRSCPCCGSDNLRLENLVIEGVVSCRDCKLTMIRRHSSKFEDDGLYLSIKAWNLRIKGNNL